MNPATPRAPLNVLVVDDSAVVRTIVPAALARDGALHVEVAADPLIAMEKMRRLRPDVILLDLEMPRMDGLTFLRKLMAEDPIPVVVCSALAGPGTEAALHALEEGALDIIVKPQLGLKEFLEESTLVLIDAVRAAAAAGKRQGWRRRAHAVAPRLSAAASLPAPAGRRRRFPSERVVVIGASTGGTDALASLLEVMPLGCPGIVIVQHMPEVFTRAFAQRLNARCRIEVKEAAAGDHVRAGRALIAPGNRHLLLQHLGDRYEVDVIDGPLVSRHRPSVDALFRSAAQAAGPHGIGIIMTGMGADGAAGLLEMRLAGAATLAQDEASCVVFGMPKEAIERGAVDEVLPLSQLPAALLRLAARPIVAVSG